MRFYEQLLDKGPRHASPLLFPHSYSNTPANLAAIEFGLGGPHMVFYGSADVREALVFAFTRLGDGTATDMLVAVHEAATARPIPDGVSVLNGSVVLWLSTDPAAHELDVPVRNLTAAVPGRELASWQERGAVFALLCLLQRAQPLGDAG